MDATELIASFVKSIAKAVEDVMMGAMVLGNVFVFLAGMAVPAMSPLQALDFL
jgi:hypothetical protein